MGAHLERADVRILGVGGAGGNALRYLRDHGVKGVSLLAANTDTQALAAHPADSVMVLGQRATRGLGAGGRPAVGFAAAQESTRELCAAVAGADLVFVAVGLGGGTGTGAAPLIAHLAHESGALVVGVASLPFGFEGSRRRRVAEAGLEALEEQVDSLILIENDLLLGEAFGADLPMMEALALADQILADGVRGIGELVTATGLVNLDFADLDAVLRDGGRAVMGVGSGRGPDRAARAVEDAQSSPLLAEASLEGAAGVLMSFTVDPDIGVNAIHRAAARVQAVAHDDAEILFGVRVDPTLKDEVHVTLIAAGFEAQAEVVELAERPDASGIRQTKPSAVETRPHEPALVGRRRNALVML